MRVESVRILPILGLSASAHKSYPPKYYWHSPAMADEQEKPVVARNLKALIGKESINSWAVRHKLTQTTVNRIVNGRDLSVSLLEKIVGAINQQGARIEPWQLLVQNFDPRNPPILLDTSTAEQLRKAIGPNAVEHRDAGGPTTGGDRWLGSSMNQRRRRDDK